MDCQVENKTNWVFLPDDNMPASPIIEIKPLLKKIIQKVK